MQTMEIEILPEEAKSELFGFYQYLLYKYDCRSKNSEKEYDVTSDSIYLLGETGEESAKVRHLIGTVESGISDLGQNHREYCRVEDVFKDIRGKIKYYDDILKPETEEWENLIDDNA